jgi:hypothetical protein
VHRVAQAAFERPAGRARAPRVAPRASSGERGGPLGSSFVVSATGCMLGRASRPSRLLVRRERHGMQSLTDRTARGAEPRPPTRSPCMGWHNQRSNGRLGAPKPSDHGALAWGGTTSVRTAGWARPGQATTGPLHGMAQPAFERPAGRARARLLAPRASPGEQDGPPGRSFAGSATGCKHRPERTPRAGTPNAVGGNAERRRAGRARRSRDVPPRTGPTCVPGLRAEGHWSAARPSGNGARCRRAAPACRRTATRGGRAWTVSES